MLPGVGFEPTTYRLQGGGANDGFRRVADALKIRWCGKAAEFALDHAGEGDRRAILEKAADKLRADRQPLRALADR